MDKDQKLDHEKVSHTAVMCASSLSKDSDVPYAGRIWDILRDRREKVVTDGKAISNNLLRMFMRKIMPGQMSVLEGRYQIVNHVLETQGPFHVMELASGLSPRGLDFTRRDPDQIYIETDLPGLQSIKKDIVDEIRKEETSRGLSSTPNYHLVPLNVVNRVQFNEAIRPYTDSARDRPLGIVNAGLWMYLGEEEQKIARDNIADVLREHSPNGAWITPDVIIGASKLISNPIVKWRIKAIEKRTGRKFSFFDDAEQARNFFAEGGLSVDVVPGSEVVDRLAYPIKRGVDVEKVRKASHFYDAYVMRPVR